MTFKVYVPAVRLETVTTLFSNEITASEWSTTEISSSLTVQPTRVKVVVPDER